MVAGTPDRQQGGAPISPAGSASSHVTDHGEGAVAEAESAAAARQHAWQEATPPSPSAQSFAANSVTVAGPVKMSELLRLAMVAGVDEAALEEAIEAAEPKPAVLALIADHELAVAIGKKAPQGTRPSAGPPAQRRPPPQRGDFDDL